MASKTPSTIPILWCWNALPPTGLEFFEPTAMGWLLFEPMAVTLPWKHFGCRNDVNPD
jgi:hypothetical protein